MQPVQCDTYLKGLIPIVLYQLMKNEYNHKCIHLLWTDYENLLLYVKNKDIEVDCYLVPGY